MKGQSHTKCDIETVLKRGKKECTVAVHERLRHVPMFRECKLDGVWVRSREKGKHVGNGVPLTPCSCMAASFSSVKPSA